MSREEQRKRSGRQNPPLSVQSAQREVDIRRWDLDPLKQYVRRYGWLKDIRNYIKRCREDNYTKPLKYLTLPGLNASDIGFLLNERVLERTEDGVLNVAICDVENADKVANNLGPWGGVLASSSNLLHEELSSDNGVFDRYFPFDVINMDLCNCLYPPKNEDNLKTLKWVFLKQQGRRFLLLLTTNPVGLAADELEKVLIQNLRHENFKKAYVERFGSDDPTACTQDRTLFAQILFPKIIAKMARPKGYRVLEHFAGRYARPSGVIIAHSFEFEPLGCDGITKYEPRFELILQSEIRQQIHIDFPKEVDDATVEAYDEFIQTVLVRESKNITAILEADHTLYEKLDREARNLNLWYQRRRRTNGP